MSEHRINMHYIVAIVIAVIAVFIILIYVAELHNVFVVVDIAVHISSWSIGFDIDRVSCPHG